MQQTVCDLCGEPAKKAERFTHTAPMAPKQEGKSVVAHVSFALKRTDISDEPATDLCDKCRGAVLASLCAEIGAKGKR